MNKKLLALAVAGAFVAPAAMADSSNVTIYGVIAMSADSVDGGSGGTESATSKANERRSRVSSNTSYIGFTGKEDLGNGLDAHFMFESVVAMDAGGSGTTGLLATGREAYAGLGNKSWGSLDFGLIDSPLKKSTGKLDLFGGGHTLGDYRSTFSIAETNVRAPNSVMYSSPNFNGFTVKAQTAAQQESGSSGSPSFWSVGGTYENGPIFATLAYEENKKRVDAASVFDTQGGLTGVGGYNIIMTGAGSDAKFKSWRAGFGYNFGAGKVGVAYTSTDLDITAGATATTTFTAPTGVTAPTTLAAGVNSSYERNSWHVSGSYNVTKATMIGLQYTKGNDIKSNVAGLSSSDTGVNQWTLGVRHDLSKRTNVYALYTQVRNDTAAGYSLGGGSSGAPAVAPAVGGEDPKAISVGMVHKF